MWPVRHSGLELAQEREDQRMTRHTARSLVLLAATLCLAACAPGAAAPKANQDGPLTIGGDKNGPTENNICASLPKKGSEVNFAGNVENPTRNPAKILAVELVAPVNVSVVAERAWDLRKSMGQFYWSAEQSDGDKDYKKLFPVLEPAEGYTIDPGHDAGVAVQSKVTSSGAVVTVGRLLVRYSMDGKD